ncbi:MAG TPA: RpiB/LacA/LacB family sugar-phosphate isomerase [Myxococcaceae bacterium]|nr:RpiB/LacA/LacB family sugar-phosphate isomerase [Myxococcaceae bacterium]
MRIALAADHAGFALKQRLLGVVRELGHEVTDLGADSEAAVDYPDLAERLGMAIRGGRADRGILLCGSGVGASVVANKIPGVRAGICHDGYSAHQGVEHDEVNVLVLGARIVGPALADERHERRLGKVKALERRWSKEQS